MTGKSRRVTLIPSNKNATRRGFEEDIVRTIHDALDGQRTYTEIENMTIGEAMRLMNDLPGEQPEDSTTDQPDVEDDEAAGVVEIARAMYNL